MNRQKLQLSAVSMAIIMTCNGCICGKPQSWSSANSSRPHPFACDEAPTITELPKIQKEIGNEQYAVRLISNESNYHVKDPLPHVSRPNSILISEVDPSKAESLLQSKLSENSTHPIPSKTSSRRSITANSHHAFGVPLLESSPPQTQPILAIGGTILEDDQNVDVNEIDELPIAPDRSLPVVASSHPTSEQEIRSEMRQEICEKVSQKICQEMESVESIGGRVNLVLSATECEVKVSQKDDSCVTPENRDLELESPNHRFDSTSIGRVSPLTAIAATPLLMQEESTFDTKQVTTDPVAVSIPYQPQLNRPEVENGLPTLPLRVVDRGWTVDTNVDPAIRARQIADSHQLAAANLLDSKPSFADRSQYAQDRNWIFDAPKNLMGESHRSQTPARMASSRQFNRTSPSVGRSSSVELRTRAHSAVREFKGYEYDRPDFQQSAGASQNQPVLYLEARPNHQPVWIPPVLNMTGSQSVAVDSYDTIPAPVDQPSSWQPPVPLDGQERWVPPRTPSRLQDFPKPSQLDRYTDRPLPKEDKPHLDR